MSRQTNERYLQRFQTVIDHIYQHLDKPLDLNHLAEIACISPYHWHRIYQGLTGETLAATVKRLRLHKAAGQLVNSQLSVDEVSQLSGYGSVQSFSRAFANAYGMPPASYRQDGRHTRFSLEALNQSAEDMKMNDTAIPKNDVSISSQPGLTLFGVRHQGSYMNIGNAFEKAFGWIGSQGLFSPEIRSVGIYFHNPDITPEAELQSMACFSLPDMDNIELPEFMERIELPAGRYAVLQHKGPYSEMAQAYGWLYGPWLAQSGEQVADRPCYEEYLNNPREVAPTELLTNICMPLI